VVAHALRDHKPGKLVFRSDGKLISLSTAQETHIWQLCESSTWNIRRTNSMYRESENAIRTV
jgi:hypothetical protein